MVNAMRPLGGARVPLGMGMPMVLERVVMGVRRHWQNSMAFVTFATEEHSRVVIAYPPAAIAGVAVMPAQHHKSDCRAIVLRWNTSPDSLPDEAIVAHFEKAFLDLMQTAASGDVSASLAALGADPGGAAQVTAVKKHRVQPMAFVSFQSPEAAAIVVKAPPTSIAGVGVLPCKKHQNEPYTVVLRWMGDQSVLSEEQIAHQFNSLFGEAVLAATPTLPDVTASALAMGGPSRLVASVKKHTQQLMCFVNFVSEDAALAFCALPMTVVGEVKVAEIKRHWTQPFCAVVEFSASAASLTEEVIASEIETHFGNILQGQSITDVSRVLAAAGFGAMPEQYGQAPPITQGSMCVSQVQKHQSLPMAYVTFRSLEVVEYVMARPPETLCGVKILLPKQHQTDPHMIVLRWSGSMGDLTEESIAAGFDSLMPAAASPGPTAQLEMQMVNQFPTLQGMPSMVPIQQTMQQLMQEPMQQPMLQLMQQPMQEPMQQAMQQPMQQPMPMMLGQAQQIGPGELVNYGVPRTRSFTCEGLKMVASVKKHWQHAMAYISFSSIEAAAIVIAVPPRVIGGVPLMSIQAHQQDPNTVVMRWQGMNADLSEEAIASELDALVCSAILGTDAMPSQELPMVASSPHAGWVGSGAVTFVKRHWQQPMAFVTFDSADAARCALASPPASIANLPVLPVMPHKSDPNTVVVRWLGAGALSEEAIARVFECCLAQAAGAPALAASAEVRSWGSAAPCQRAAPGGFTMVREVRKHRQQPMAFVTFTSPTSAAALVRQPPPSIAGFFLLPLRAHQTDPTTVVLRWTGSQSSLSEEAIAAELEALLSTALLPEPSAVPDGSAGKLAQPPGQSLVKRVMKHQSKPVAFAKFHVAEAARALMAAAPAELGSSPVEQIQAHWNDDTTVVLNFRCPIESVREAEVVQDIENLLASAIAAECEAPMKRPGGFSLHQPPFKVARVPSVDASVGDLSSDLGSASEIVKSLLASRADPAIQRLLGCAGS